MAFSSDALDTSDALAADNIHCALACAVDDVVEVLVV